ncbi:MAG: MFS transporter [Ruegeria sp.]
MTDSFRTLLQVILLWIAGLGAATQFAKIAIPFADVGLLYPDNADAIGWMLSIISLTGVFLGAMSGAIVGQVGPSKLLMSGLVLGGAISLFQATVPGFHLMLASRIIEGLSHLAIAVAAPTLIAQITQGKARNMAMVLWSTFFGVAFALNAWFGIPFVSRFGLPSFFALHGVLMLVIAASVFLFPARVEGEASGESNWSFASFIEANIRSYRSPFISAPAIGWLFYTLTFVSLLAILPGRLPEDVSASVAGFMPLAGIIMSWAFVPLLLNFMSCIAVVNLGFGLGILAIVSLYFGAPLAFACVALFAVLGLVQGGSFAAVPELNASVEDQALSYGAMAQTGNAGNLLGTPVLLAILWRTSDVGMFATVIGFYGIAIAFNIWLGRQRRIANAKLA